ncbi:hypothetical protein EI555_016019, partial [Monodon monoceros]
TKEKKSNISEEVLCKQIKFYHKTSLQIMKSTSNFTCHLNQRHQFDYGVSVNLHLGEETQYQTAVEESFQVNI